MYYDCPMQLRYDLSMEQVQMKAVLKCTTMVPGVLCVLMDGTSLMLEWSAESWDILELLPLMVVLTLDKEMVPSGWMMSSVREEKIVSVAALIMVGGLFQAAITDRM